MTRCFVKKHWPLIIGLALVYILGILTVAYKPLFPEYSPLEKTFWLFGLSLDSAVILIGLGAYLLYRWHHSAYKNITNFIWGISFLLYSIVFIGMMLQALGAPWANAKLPEIFFIYRQFMIIWTAGMTFGLFKILTNNRSVQLGLPAAILIAGYAWFWYGLLMVKDVEYTMYGFLFGIFIPVCFLLAYLFWKFASANKIISLKYVAIGFLGIAIMYGLWAPWHKTKIYAVCFFLYLLSLIPLLIGFLMLPWEQKSKWRSI